MENAKGLLLILVVIIVGSYGGYRVMHAPSHPIVAASVKEGAADPLNTPAKNADADEKFDYAVSYEIQACVDDKATVMISGDKVMVSDLSGEGLGGGSCSAATKNKLTVVPHSTTEQGSDALVLESPKQNEFFGTLRYPIPMQETVRPAELYVISADIGAGAVTLTEAPTSPRYRARISFNDAQAYAHEYVVRLVLKYRGAPPVKPAAP